MSEFEKRYVVVGVTPGQDDAVLLGAAYFAKKLGAELICAHVDTTRLVVDERPDGTVTSMLFDPEIPDVFEAVFDDEFAASITQVLAEENVPLTFRELAGDTARALASLADIFHAELIVVGSRQAGFRASLKEFFSGAVGAHLAHRQCRPVLVVPQSPIGKTEALPWESMS